MAHECEISKILKILMMEHTLRASGTNNFLSFVYVRKSSFEHTEEGMSINGNRCHHQRKEHNFSHIHIPLCPIEILLLVLQHDFVNVLFM